VSWWSVNSALVVKAAEVLGPASPGVVLTVTLGGDDSVVVSRSWVCTGGPDRFLLARGRVRRQGEDVR
jgi:hypothetical protein